MHLLILGGNGRTGYHVVDQALERGHTLTALVRNPENFPKKEGLTVVKGTPVELGDIERAFRALKTDAKDLDSSARPVIDGMDARSSIAGSSILDLQSSGPPADDGNPSAQRSTMQSPPSSASEPQTSVAEAARTKAIDTPSAIELHPEFVKPDVVVVTLNAPRKSDSPFAKSIAPPRMMADSVGNAVKVMQKFEVRRIIVMQGFGVGDSFKNNNFLMRFMLSRTEMAKQFDDHNMVDKELREVAQDGSITWTMVRPVMLKGEGVLPITVLGDDGSGASFLPQISRESVAKFILEDCVENPGDWDMRTPVICN